MEQAGEACRWKPRHFGVPKKPAFGFLGWIYAGEQGFQALRKGTLFLKNSLSVRASARAGGRVVFTQPPVAIGPVMTAVLDDTCGNLIQLAQKG